MLALQEVWLTPPLPCPTSPPVSLAQLRPSQNELQGTLQSEYTSIVHQNSSSHLSKHSGEWAVPTQGPPALYSLGKPVKTSLQQGRDSPEKPRDPTPPPGKSRVGWHFFPHPLPFLHSFPTSQGRDLRNPLFWDLLTSLEKLWILFTHF